MSIKRNAESLYLILPAVLMLAFFTLFPFFYSIRTSLLQWNLVKPQLGIKYIGLSNFLRMLQDVRFWESLKVTVIMVTSSIALSLAIGLIVALMLNESFRGCVIFRLIFLIPMFITPVVIGIMWLFLFNAELGLVNYLLGLLNIGQVGWFGKPNMALLVIVLIDVWEWTPFVILILLTGLQSLPTEPFQAAVIDGAGGWQIFKFITMPLLKPLVLTTIIIRTMDSFRIFDIIYVTTRGGPGKATENLNLFGFINAFEYYHVGYASAITVFLMFIIIVVSTVYTKLISVERY